MRNKNARAEVKKAHDELIRFLKPLEDVEDFNIENSWSNITGTNRRAIIGTKLGVSIGDSIDLARKLAQRLSRHIGMPPTMKANYGTSCEYSWVIPPSEVNAFRYVFLTGAIDGRAQAEGVIIHVGYEEDSPESYRRYTRRG